MERTKTELLEQSLERISLPSISTPLHKERLRAALLSELKQRKRETPKPFFRTRLLYTALPLVAAVLLIIVWQGVFVTPPTMAYATLQANPTFEFAIDTRGRIAGITPLGNNVGDIFTPTDFRHMLATKALPEIITRLYRAGFLQGEGDLVLLLHPAGNFDQKQVLALLNSLRKSAARSLAAVNPLATPSAHFISEAVSKESRAAGLLPIDFVSLLEDELDEEMLLPLLRLGKDLSLDEDTFRQRFAQLTKSVREARREELKPEEIIERAKKSLAEEEKTEQDNDKGRGEDEDKIDPPRRPPQSERNPKENDKDDKDKEDRVDAPAEQDQPEDDRPGQNIGIDNGKESPRRDQDKPEDDGEDEGKPQDKDRSGSLNGSEQDAKSPVDDPEDNPADD